MSDSVNEESTSESTAPDAEVLQKRSRKRPLSVSPQKRGESLRTLPGGCCIKCNDELGADSKAIQCDLCGSWIHAACENISDEVYGNMNVVLGSVNNLVYYCETNNCTSRIKQLLFNFFNGSDSPTGNSTSIEEPTQSQITMQQNFLTEKLNDLNQKIADLANKQQTLQNSVQPMSSKYVESVTNMEIDVPSIPPSNSALAIVNEMKYRECRKLNLMVYNFPIERLILRLSRP